MAPRHVANKSTPVIDLAGGTLTVPAADGGAATVLRLDSALFRTWISSTNGLYVNGGAVPFSLHRVKVQRGSGYWQARRTVNSRRYTRHIGTDAAVTADNLRAAAAALVDRDSE